MQNVSLFIVHYALCIGYALCIVNYSIDEIGSKTTFEFLKSNVSR